MPDVSFEERVHQLAELAVMKLLSSGDWIKVDYNARVSVGQSDLNRIYGLIDKERVFSLIAKRIEERLAEGIINGMITEIATDVKKIMCNADLREDLRSIMREKIKSAAAELTAEKPQS